jgi:hypothetical protein
MSGSKTRVREGLKRRKMMSEKGPKGKGQAREKALG